MKARFQLTVGILLFALASAVAAQGEETQVASALTVDAQLATGIEDRMPVGAADNFGADVEKVYLWTKVTGAIDTTVIKHVWSYEGKEMAVVELPVRSPSWRTWSSKNILPEWTGDWEVKVLDAGGEVLKALSFTIGASETEEPVEETGPADTSKSEEP